jgi:serine/threonine protein kinase
VNDANSETFPREVSDGRGTIYRLLSRLGSGVSGSVYLCEDDTGQRYAIKRVLPSSEEQREAWGLEAAMLAGLSNMGREPHPNITRVYDAFMASDGRYIVLEHCAGSLDDLLRACVLGPGWVLPVASGLLHGLAWIHEVGALHGDLSAGNILFAGGRIEDPWSYVFKVSDLGFGGRWAPLSEVERPELIAQETASAACLLCQVALGRLEGLTREEASASLGQLADELRSPIEIALFGGFQGTESAASFYAALTSATTDIKRRR